ncbi:uncharacterized protein TM35_000022080 [Trypanosoma theileri]|uniref:HEAT repeat-containing protein 1 n=1 Tax=Trypanosoma theileri TaxID=67003 RepID=A0A1X0P7H2_9TRYP|nr:uncharacterized protein TM35_000022080 [Trypanosoma theileri]ORC92882.1 hypothetical protein TM35_000022080 [Trypanosoma theileri]
MTSQLASQLQKLQQRPVGDKRLTQSFLFDSTEARSFSREQIHQLAVHGLQTLIAIDNRLHPFLEELFHPHKTRTERKLLSTEENQALDVTIERFLTLLSPHMFLTAAHQVFEYLVRVHEVHVYNVAAVLRTFLPYHDHSLFVRAVMLLDLRDTGFSFLSKNQEYGAPLLREHLVLACAESRKALRLVCLTLAMSVRMKVHNNAANALFTGVAVQLASHPDAETIWRVLLPFLVEFLSGAASGAEKGELLSQQQQQQQESHLLEDTQGGDTQIQLPSREVVCSALVVLAAWSNEVQLTVPTLATVMKPTIALLTRASSYTTFNASSSSSTSFNVPATVPTSDLLGVIDLLFYTQRSVVTQVTFGPQIQMLLALPWKQWSPWIAAVAEETAAVDAGMYNSLISVLLRHCLQRLRVAHSLDSISPDVLGFVQCAVENLPLSDTLVTEVIQTLMTCHARISLANPQDNNNNKQKNNKKKNNNISNEEEEITSGDNELKKKENENGSSLTAWMRALERRFAHVFDTTLSQLLNDVTTQSAAAAFVAQHLSGTRYELLEVRGASGKVERLPLFSCLLHPLPEVRLLAARELHTMTAQQLMTSSSKSHGSTAGNSMLDLLEHVMQYEQSYKVSEQFLHTSVSAMEKLLSLTSSDNEDDEDNKESDNNNKKSSIEQKIVLSHLRSMLRSLWMMLTQHDVNLQKEFLHVVLQPLIMYVEKHISNSSVNKKNKKKQQSSLNMSNHTLSSYNEVHGLLVYYLTLLYVDCTDRQTRKQLDHSTLEEESNKKRDDQLRELISELEQQLLSIVPNMNRTATFFNPASGEEMGKNGKNDDDDDDTESSDDDDEESALRGKKNEKVKKGSTLQGTSKEITDGYLSVFESVPLLLLLRSEASARLNSTLAQLASNTAGEFLSRESRGVMLECCLACASCLTTAAASEMDGVIRLLWRFFLGENTGSVPSESTAGYLESLQESQRAALRGAAVKVGRGAKNSLAAPYVPRDELTAAVGWTVRRGVEMRLTSSSHQDHPNGNHLSNGNNNNKCEDPQQRAGDEDDNNDWMGLVRVGRLLGLLSTPLPAVAVSPARLSPVYMQLLERCYNVEKKGNEASTAAAAVTVTDGDNKENQKTKDNTTTTTTDNNKKNVYGSDDGMEGRFPVDWFDLVYTAVFRTVGNDSINKNKNDGTVETKMFSLSALTLTLLTPLAAPTTRRERVLQELQGIILTASSSHNNKTTATVSVAQKVIESAIHKEHISATTLNAIVEVMAREESRGNITQTAAALLCRMMANMNNNNAKMEPVMPFSVSCHVLEYFFPIRSNSNNNNNKNSNNRKTRTSSHIAIHILLPLLKNILVTGGSGGKHTGASVSSAASNFLHAVCLRTDLNNTSGEGKEEKEKEEKAVLELCLELLRHPFLRVAGSRVRPVYRHALRAFAIALSHGLEGEQTNSLVFIPNKNKNNSSTRGSGSEVNTAAFLAHMTESLSHVMFDDNTCLNRLGADAAQFLLGTLGGYHRLFLPWLTRLLKEENADLSIVADVVEVLAAPSMGDTTTTTTITTSIDTWEPPSWCALHSPMTFTDVQTLLQLCSKVLDIPQETGKHKKNKNSNKLNEKEHQSQSLWPRNANTLSAVRLLCSLVALSPSVRIDDDDQTESLFALINGLLEQFPLTALLPLLTESDNNDDNEKSNGMLPFNRYGMMYVRTVVGLCISSPHALNEGEAHGASRIARVLVKQTVMLMAALLVPDDNTTTTTTEKSSEETSESTFSRHRIDTIANLLRIVSPLFTPTVPGSVSASASAAAAPSFAALHIPVVALLIRLESMDFSLMQSRYESAMDVCSSLLASFDIHTQLSCLAQMMQLLIDPHQQLSSSSSAAAAAAQNQREEDEEDDNIVKLFRKLVKPNQVINRQETILHLVNMTVKSEAFLGGFLELQHHSHTSRTSHSKQQQQEGENENEADEHPGSTEVEKGTKTDDACMRLLVSSLELFAHYAELNGSTANDAPTTTTTITRTKEEKEELPEFGENKAFVMLLELLAGNTLACVLAGINEPTFVSCLRRLLTDSRVPLQRKGLEVLLDRLHHALPTVEHTLTDAELEQHRQELRDPKRKLTLMDLVRVKARPLATKRSFALFPHLATLLSDLFKTTTTTNTTAESSTMLNTAVEMLPLTVSCMEELVRIVSSGGSLQAEKTLLNVHRSNRVTEAMLSKLFGNKARVQEVHRWVEDILKMLPRLLHCDAMSVKTGGINTTGSSSSLSLQEGVLITAAGLLTALGTISQVMGTAFTTPHSNDILQVVASSAVFAVSGIPAIVSRSEVGSLLRQASLSCLLRVFPSCWLMCQPYLPRIIFAATHLHNVDDTETNYRSEETMAMLEAVLEPQLFIEACTECLRGVSTSVTTMESKKNIRVRVETHSFALFYNSVKRRVQGLKREELQHLHILVGGTTPQDNFWLASFQALATAPALPSRDIVQPVLEAYTVFFLKFKSKHCTRYLSTVAEWAFGGDAESLLKNVQKQQALQQQQEEEYEEEEEEEEEDNNKKGRNGGNKMHRRDDALSVTRTTLHCWLLFYALCNHLLEKLGSILDFGFPVVLPYVVSTLTAYCSSTQHTMKQAASLIARTLEGALDVIRRIALAQTPAPNHDYSIPVENYLSTPTVFTAVMPALVRQLTNVVYLADGTHDYNFRVDQFVIPAIRAFFNSLAPAVGAAPSQLQQQQQQSKTQQELLRALRHTSRHVRSAVLRCLDGVYADGGDELAARLMAEMLPAAVEATEDRDAAVVEQARRLCLNLSAITGQDVLYAMSA